jgi:hypothetical protein
VADRPAVAALVAAAMGAFLPARAGARTGDGERWSRQERAAIDASLARLPALVRARAPRAILDDAVGCGTDSWPAEDDAIVDRGGRIHLCPAAPGETAADVGRRAALAVLFAFDRAAGWSSDPGWRRLNGWRWSVAAGLRAAPDNLAPSGFAAERGRRSPAWDLATFMAALLLESRDAGADVDGGIGCRLISQAAFVRARLGLDAPTCSSFEGWADLDHLAAVEVVLAAPSTALVGSLFGHLFVRLVYRDDAGATPPHLSRTVAFLADNDRPFNDDPAYAFKGIFGVYSASLHERDFLDAYREYVVVEGRDLRRWRLELSADERRRLLERIWTARLGLQRPYYFFSRNCATMMLDLFNDVLPPERAVASPGLLAAPPPSSLEAWERAPGAGGRPLLTFVPEPILSFDHRARQASRHRKELEERIAGGSGVVRGAFDAAHGPDAEARAAAYDRLARRLADPQVGASDDVHAWLRDSAVIESLLSTAANLQAEARAERRRRRRVAEAAARVMAQLRSEAALAPDGARLRPALAQLDDPAPAERLEGYRALAALVADPTISPERASRLRLLALLQSELRYDVARMKAVPGLRDALLFADAGATIEQQPYLRGQEDLMRLPVETRISAALRSLQRAKQALFAARGPDDTNEDDDRGGAATDETAVARREYEASLPRSGIDQAAVLAGFAGGGGPGAPAWGVVLEGALYDERLGDHRRFGFPAETSLIVGRTSALLALATGVPRPASYDARLFGYRSLRAPLPESGGGAWPLGWEAYVDAHGSQSRALAAEVNVGWGLLAPVVTGDDLGRHLLGSLGLAYASYFPAGGARGGGHPQAAGAPLGLELRAGAGTAARHRSWVAARSWLQPMAVLAGAPARLTLEAGATLEGHLALRDRTGPAAHDPALLVRATLLRTPLSFSGGAWATEALLSAGVELR